MPPELPDFFDINSALLKSMHPHVYEAISTLPNDSIGDLFLSPQGLPNLRVENKKGESVFFHPEEDPLAKMDQFLNVVPEGTTAFVTLLGMGLGYTAIHLLKERPNIRHLAIFELIPEIFLQAMQVMDLSPLLKDPRVILSVSTQPDLPVTLATAQRALQLEDIIILRHEPAFSYDPKSYNTFTDKLYTYVNSLNLAGSTTLELGEKFFRNRFRQLTSMGHHSLLGNLKEALSGIPAVLVGGGPSLDKNIHLLSEIKDKAVIIAVDSVLPALLANGVTPHFITAIDSENLVYEKIAGAAPETKGAALICMSSVTPKVPKIFPAEHVFWAFSLRPVEKWINVVLGGKTITAGTGVGTVAHLNLVSAFLMGCSPIIFIGQDLAFSNTQDHASQTVLTNKDYMNKMIETGKDLVLVDGNDGTKLPTSRAFFSHISFFENFMVNHPNQYINATEGGALLKGTEVLSLQEVIDQYCNQSQDIQPRIEKCNIPADTENMVNELSEILNKTDILHNQLNKAKRLIQTTRQDISALFKKSKRIRSLADLPPKIIKRLTELDTLNKKIDDNPQIWTLLQEITMKGLQQSERLQAEISSIANQPEKFSSWLKKSLARLTEVNEFQNNALAIFQSETKNIISYHTAEKSKNDLALVKHYFDHEDYMLAVPVLDELKDTRPEDPMVNYYRGCISLLHTEYQQAEEQFQKCLEKIPKLQADIDKFRKKCADEYLGIAEYFKENDRGTARRMLLKGLKYYRNHTGIQDELDSLAEETLEKVQQETSGGHFDKSKDLVGEWLDGFESDTQLAESLKPASIAEFYYYSAQILANEKLFEEAKAQMDKALHHNQKEPALHISLMEILFNLSDFPQAINHLEQAVNIDRNFAAYWEGIGDNLSEAGQFNDAIMAYEKYFVALPEKFNILKKIGACYHAMGEMEAAKTALELFKEKQGEFV